MKTRRLIFCGLLLNLLAAQLWGAERDPSPRKAPVTGRVVGTVLGGVGGAVLGLFMLDDDKYTTRTHVVSAVLVGAAGATAGFFLGRRADRRALRQAPPDAALRAHVRQSLLAREDFRIRNVAEFYRNRAAPEKEPVPQPGDGTASVFP